MATVALTAAIMDMCHAGHINLLEEMNKRADISVVVLHTDESCWRIKHKVPVQHLETRIRNLVITGLVHHILVSDNDDPSQQFLAARAMYPEDDFVFMRGNDNVTFPGWQTIKKLGIPVEFIPYTEGVSSTYLREVLR